MPKEILLYEEDINLTSLTEETDVQDIAPTASNLTNIAVPAVSQTLPFMIGYVQNINASQGFVFGLTSRDKTSISNPDYPATPNNPASPDTPDDLIVTRSLIQTSERGVNISVTNEVEHDVMTLFNPTLSNTEFYGGENGKIGQFFLEYGNWRLNNKTNADFMNWLDGVCTVKGSATIDNYAEMDKILGIIGELKEALFKQSGKSGRTWIIVTPRIANYLSTVNGFVNHNNSEWFMNGRKIPSTSINPYVGTFGDTDVFVYNSSSLAGGTSATTETSGEIFMGLLGGPGTSSIFYTPYKKFVIKGGSDSYTGQSVMFFRIRDAWMLNPQDTLDENTTGTELPEPNNNSKFVVKADISFTETLLS